MITTLLLVDDHFLVRDGIKALLEDEPQYKVAGEAANGQEALKFVQEHKPDIVICDIRMPEMSGIETVEKISSINPSVKKIMLSMHDSEEYILQSLQSGADGYLLKDASKEEFLKALATVSKGEKYFSGDVSTVLVNNLIAKATEIPKEEEKGMTENKELPYDVIKLTKREKQILEFVISGLTNKEIADILDLSKRTVEVHRFNLMKKMDVKNVLEMSSKAKELNLI